MRRAPPPALLALAMLASCLPERLDETGKRCDPAQRCSDDYSCVGGRCRAGPPPANRLINPDFESGATPTGWSISGQTIASIATDGAEHGAQALRIRIKENTSDATSVRPAVDAISDAVAGSTWCFSGYARSPTRPEQLDVYFYEGLAGTNASTLTVGGEWTLFTSSHLVKAGPALSVRLVLPGPFTQGQLLDVDDLILWNSADGQCP